MKIKLAVAILTLSLASCSPSEVEATTTPSAPSPGAGTPIEAVENLIGLLAAKDYDSISTVVDDSQLAVLIAVEVLDPGESIAIINDGVNDAMRANFWSAFSEGIPGFVGESLEDMRIGDPDEFFVGDRRFAAVPVTFPIQGGTAEWITSDHSTGWKIDLLATFGAPFASALSRMIDQDESDQGRAALFEEIASLQASRMRQVGNRADQRVIVELESLISRLDP